MPFLFQMSHLNNAPIWIGTYWLKISLQSIDCFKSGHQGVQWTHDKTDWLDIHCNVCVCVCVCVCVRVRRWFAGTCARRLARLSQKKSLSPQFEISPSNFYEQVIPPPFSSLSARTPLSLSLSLSLSISLCNRFFPPTISVVCFPRQPAVLRGAVVRPPEECPGGSAAAGCRAQGQRVRHSLLPLHFVCYIHSQCLPREGLHFLNCVIKLLVYTVAGAQSLPQAAGFSSKAI